MNSGAKKEIVRRFDLSEIFCRALGRSDARKAEVGVRTGKGMGPEAGSGREVTVCAGVGARRLFEMVRGLMRAVKPTF
jgi:hypothetical protein